KARCRRIPPGLRMLFGPQRPRSLNVQRCIRARKLLIVLVNNDCLDAGRADIDAEKRARHFLSISASAAAAVFSSVTSTPPSWPRNAAAMTGALFTPPAISITVGILARRSSGGAMARRLMPWLIGLPLASRY